MLKSIILSSEVYESGCLVTKDFDKKFIMRDSEEYPITYGKVDEFLKLVGKEVLDVLKAGKGNKLMLTLYEEDNFFTIGNVCRITFDVWNGEIVAQYRMHIEGEGFPIAVETKFNSNVKAKNYVVKMLESHVHEMVEVKDNSENYFTKYM